MASKTTTTWTCDRCGTSEITTPSATPVTWRRVTLLRGPLHSAATDPIVDRQICDECVASFAVWIDVAEEPA